MKIAIRKFTLAIAIACACCAATTFAQHGRLPTSSTPPQPTRTPARDEPPPPSMKKSERVDVAPSHAHRAYDAAHDTTYVSVDIPVVSHTQRKLPSGAFAFEGRDVTLTFQLAYRGKRTEDLRSAHVIIESTSEPTASGTASSASAGDRLSGALRLELRADAYEYSYERAEYKIGAVEQTGAASKNAPALKREVALFRIETEDLAAISSANRLELKLGAETFTIKSPQLSDLRRTLANGDNK